MNPYSAYSAADRNIDWDNKPKLLLKVYQSMLDKIDVVKAAIQKKNFEKKYDELTKLTMAIDILNASLDMSQGDISRNLSDLYQYLVRRLTGIHASHDQAALDECREIISQINEGFVAAYNQERKEKGELREPSDPEMTSFAHRTI